MKNNSKAASERWFSFAKKCAELKTFNALSLREEMGVDAKLINTIIDLGWVVKNKVKGSYNWIGVEVIGDVQKELLFNTHRKLMNSYAKNRVKVNALKFNLERVITEEQAIECLRRAGGYEIYRVEKKAIL